MKIAIALYKIMDLGGIINHTEDLIYGLQQEGHDVTLLQLVYTDKSPRDSTSRTGTFSTSNSGLPYNQKTGWLFPARSKIPYAGKKLEYAKEVLSSYDMVIWTIPVPSTNAENKGNWEWTELYDLPDTKQVAFIHDGGACDRYPYIMEIQDKLDGIMCVHHSAIGGSTFIKTPRYHVLNPFVSVNRECLPWAARKKGFVSLQTFKGLKHVDDLVRAIRYMPPRGPREHRDIFGKGIEYQYMTSVDKCKPKYFHEDGERIWDAAEANGMVHHDYIERKEVDLLLQTSRVLVDPSWSTRLGERGGFYGRVFVEAAINGALPVGRPLGIGDNLFKPDEHYVSIPMDADDQTYADMVMSASSDSDANGFMRENLRDLVQQFDASLIARRVVAIATGEIDEPPLPWNPDRAADLEDKAEEIMFNHFGI